MPRRKPTLLKINLLRCFLPAAVRAFREFKQFAPSEVAQSRFLAESIQRPRCGNVQRFYQAKKSNSQKPEHVMQVTLQRGDFGVYTLDQAVRWLRQNNYRDYTTISGHYKQGDVDAVVSPTSSPELQNVIKIVFHGPNLASMIRHVQRCLPNEFWAELRAQDPTAGKKIPLRPVGVTTQRMVRMFPPPRTQHKPAVPFRPQRIPTALLDTMPKSVSPVSDENSSLCITQVPVFTINSSSGS